MRHLSHRTYIYVLVTLSALMSEVRTLERRVCIGSFDEPMMRDDFKQLVQQVPWKLRYKQLVPWKISVNECEVRARGFEPRSVCNCTRTSPFLDFALYGFDDALQCTEKMVSYNSDKKELATVRATLENKRCRYLLRALINTNSTSYELFPVFPIQFRFSFRVPWADNYRKAYLDATNFSEIVTQVLDYFLDSCGNNGSAELRVIKQIAEHLFMDPPESCIHITLVNTEN